MKSDNVQIIAALGESGYASYAENNPDLLKLLGIMMARFNVLENNLSLLICIKFKIILKGKTYEHISEEMTFRQKSDLLGSYLSDELKQRLEKLNRNRNKVIHGLFQTDIKTKKITVKYKGTITENLDDFFSQINTEVSNLCIEIHNIIIYPTKLGSTP